MGSSIWHTYTPASAVIDCRNYRLSEYSRNDTTCRLLMPILIHKRHIKITASSHQQDVTLMLNGIKTHRQPGGKFVSEVNIAHDQGFWIYLYFRIRHSFAHVWTILNKMASFGVIAHVRAILNKMASFGVNIYRSSASEHGQNITNITMI